MRQSREGAIERDGMGGVGIVYRSRKIPSCMLAFALKVIGAVVLAALITVAAGLTGALFSVWPTFWPDRHLAVTSVEVAELQALRADRKFVPDARIFYPGGISPERRLASERLVNGLIDTLVRDIPGSPTKTMVLSRMKVVLATHPVIDTEDKAGC
jgi:hypothetical protein